MQCKSVICKIESVFVKRTDKSRSEKEHSFFQFYIEFCSTMYFVMKSEEIKVHRKIISQFVVFEAQLLAEQPDVIEIIIFTSTMNFLK